MPSKDSETPKKDEAKVVKFKAGEDSQARVAKKKGGITVSKVITYIILGLLAIVLVGGVFPSFGTGGSPSQISFGSYDGIPIEFSYGNYFYRQYQTQAQQNTGSGEMAAYQIWRAAFESTVFHTAISKMAEKVGIRVVDETLNKAIIDSGAYHRDGKFDVATYEKASVESKNQLKTNFEENLPVQMVMEDITTVLSSPAEMDYIVAMGDDARSFDYVVFDASSYPDDLTRNYAMANPALFTMIDVSMITVADAAAAETLRSAIVSGETTFADAARANSIDGFADEGGKAGVWYLYELQTNFTNSEEVNALFSSAVGEVTVPYASPSGAVLYRVEQKPFTADFEDPEVLSDVKTYIGANDADVLTSYLLQEAQTFAQEAATSESLLAAATAAGYEVIQVGATPANVGGSNYLTGFSYTDPRGHLTRLANNSDAMRNLYSLEIGAVSDPIASGSMFVVASATGKAPMDSEMSDYLRLVYPYMSQSQSQQDLVQSIFTSEKLEDNFLMAFMENIMGVQSTN